MMFDQSAELISFPIDRRVPLVRRAAQELLALNGEPANVYWRSLAARLLRELIDQGKEMEAARVEVLRFFEAVQAEFRREMAAQRSVAPA
jgi:hypothetical protein